MINEKIKDRIEGLEGKIGIYYIDLKSEQTCFVGNQDVFAAAGSAMLAVLLAVFRRFEDGLLKKEDIYVLTEEDKAPSIGVVKVLRNGITLTMEDLYKIMITVSDNTAYNILVDILGVDYINQTMMDMGFYKTVVNRKFYDYTKMKQGIENYFSLQEVAEIFHRLYKGQIISRKASEEILDVLKNQQRSFVIPFHFGTGVTVAHITGEDEGTLHDAGIVYGNHPFIICMGSNEADVRKVDEAMRDVVYMCYRNSMKYN